MHLQEAPGVGMGVMERGSQSGIPGPHGPLLEDTFVDMPGTSWGVCTQCKARAGLGQPANGLPATPDPLASLGGARPQC